MASHPVVLHVYDLSGGMAAQFAPALGIPIDGIWHTGVVVHGTEFYFGGGICADPPGRTPYGTPVSTHTVGTTGVSRDAFTAHLRAVLAPAFTAATYHLLDHNCNHFSAAAVAHLCGPDARIPAYVSDLPAVALASPLGALLRQSLDGLQAQIRNASAGHELAGAAGAGAPRGRPRPAPPEETALARAVRTPVVAAVGATPKIVAALAAADPAFGAPPADGRPPVGALLASLARAPSFAALDLLRLAAAEAGPRAAAVAAALPSLLATYAVPAGASPLAATSAAAAAAGWMMTLRAAVNLLAGEATARPLLAAAAPAGGTVATQLAAAVAPAVGGPTGGVRVAGALLCRALARAAVHGWGGGEDGATAVVDAAAGRLGGGGGPPAPPDEADHLLTAVGLAVGGWPALGGLVAAMGVDLGRYGQGGVAAELRRLLEAVNGAG